MDRNRLGIVGKRHTPTVVSLWLVLATAGDRKLAQTIEYLKAENAILRSKLPKRITLTVATPFVKDPKPAKVVCRERLGGLLKPYSRIAA